MKRLTSLILVILVCMLAKAQTLPSFSSDGDSGGTYYLIQFNVNSHCWTAPTSGDLIYVTSKTGSDYQLWKFVGTKDNFQIVNKATNKYVVVSNTAVSATSSATANSNPLRLSDSQQSQGFSFVSKDSYFEIAANANGTSTTCNLWGYPGNNNSIGLWSTGDVNNQINIVDPDEGDTEGTSTPYTVTGISNYKPTNDLTLWYTEPATTAKVSRSDTPANTRYSNWMEWSLPIGNGQFGASLFGGVARDEIQFNDKTLWSGSADDLTSGGSGYGKYENFGSLYAYYLGSDISTSSLPTDYYRQLDLSTATGKVSFKSTAGVTYTREYIASYPAKAVIIRYSADQDNKINLRFAMVSGGDIGASSTTYEDSCGTFSGSMSTVHYNARFKVVNTGGTLKTASNGIIVKNANEVLVVLAGGTDYDAYSYNYISKTELLGDSIKARVDNAAAKDWTTLYDEHEADYTQYFDRVTFDINNSQNTVTTNSLIDSYNSGSGSNASMLERLYFAYGRYLEISSSRGVDLPSNLQGIWNPYTGHVDWNSDIHANINVEMNYWPAEPTNLSEMHMPFLNYIWNMAVNHGEWKKNAKVTSGQERGWTCYTENNIFGGGSKWKEEYTIANAWYCTHLWQHYRYTLDRDYLYRVFPAMLSCAQYWMDRLVLASDGTYEAPNEWSPEHGPASENATAHAQQILNEFFANTLEAIKVLGDDAGISDEDMEKLKSRYAKLDSGLRTETYNGGFSAGSLASGSSILREWKYTSYSSGTDGHRHNSHLMCLYPFSQVEPGTDLFNAAVNSLILRGDGELTGWSIGWKINLWAHALNSAQAYSKLNVALAHTTSYYASGGVYYNLFDAHAPFQIDGNFGVCTGIAEMIMQSNSGVIRILPALPSAWSTGSMHGLKAVGNFTVDIDWEGGIATRVVITNNSGQEIPVLYANLNTATLYKDNVKTDFTVDSDGKTTIDGTGTTYVFDFNNSYSSSRMYTNIADVQAESVRIAVGGGMVNVIGEGIRQVRVLNMQGQVVMTTTEKSFAMDRDRKQAYIVEASGDNGVVRKKVVL